MPVYMHLLTSSSKQSYGEHLYPCFTHPCTAHSHLATSPPKFYYLVICLSSASHTRVQAPGRQPCVPSTWASAWHVIGTGQLWPELMNKWKTDFYVGAAKCPQ